MHDMCDIIFSEKLSLPILTAPLQFVVSYAINARQKFVQTSFCQKLSSLATFHYCRWHLRPIMLIQSRIVSSEKSESHNIGQLRTPSVPSAKRTLRRIGHSRSFKVILIGLSWNPERIVVIMYNNVDINSETYEDNYSTRKTANSPISTTPLRFDDSNLRKAFD